MEVSNRIQDMNKDFRSRLTPQNVKWFFTKYATYTLGGLGCGYAFNQITRTAFLAALGVAVAAVNYMEFRKWLAVRWMNLRDQLERKTTTQKIMDMIYRFWNYMLSVLPHNVGFFTGLILGILFLQIILSALHYR